MSSGLAPVKLSASYILSFANAQLRRDPLSLFRFKSEAQRKLVRYICAGFETLFRAGNSAGKAQPVDEPVLTPTGFVPIGSLNVGDEVVAGDGTITEVTGVFPQGELPVFRLHFGDRSWTRCSEDHLWWVSTVKDKSWRVESLASIRSRYGDHPTPTRRVRVPTMRPAALPARLVPIDPYVLGVLIGDGCMTSGLSFTTGDPEIVESVRAALPRGIMLSERASPDRCTAYSPTTGVVGGDRRTRPRNTVLEALRDMGLAGHGAGTKFVPELYRFNDIPTRLGILQGLMDTDGTVSKGGSPSFCSISPTLAEHVVWLVRSLGGRASTSSRITNYTHLGKRLAGKRSWIVHVRLPDFPLFRLERKLSRCRPTYRTSNRVLRHITPDGSADCVCISVAHPHQSYVTRAGIVTHNTFVGGAIAVALLRGKKDLGGEPLPEVPTPCIGWCVVQTYKGQVDGAQAAVLHWLGEWPHKIVYGISEAKGWIDSIWVATDRCKHGMGEKCKTCSKLVFHCAESDSSIGGRVHFVWADEPPKKEVWDECRQRSTAKHLLVRYITATPKEKQWWWWMPADFHDCEDKPREGYVEIRSSMMDNSALSPAVLKQKLSGASKDQRARSVIYGDYIDLKGECPFPPDKLEVWLARCKPPRLKDFTVAATRRTADGDAEVLIRCRVEIFADYDPDESYICTIDPATFLRLDPVTGMVATDWTREGSSARGVPDPCGLHIYARRKPKLVVRFSGYSGAHGLGSLAVAACRQYGNALLDTDLTGGHGEPAMRAILAAGYRNVNAYNALATSPTSHTQRLGFTMTGAVRAQMISAIQQALMDDSVVVQSEAAIRSLMAVTYVITAGGNERPEASYGSKDEDMICLGRFLHLTMATPLPKAKMLTGDQKMGLMLGRPILGRRHAPKGRVLWSPRRA